MFADLIAKVLGGGGGGPVMAALSKGKAAAANVSGDTVADAIKQLGGLLGPDNVSKAASVSELIAKQIREQAESMQQSAAPQPQSTGGPAAPSNQAPGPPPPASNGTAPPSPPKWWNDQLGPKIAAMGRQTAPGGSVIPPPKPSDAHQIPGTSQAQRVAGMRVPRDPKIAAAGAKAASAGGFGGFLKAGSSGALLGMATTQAGRGALFDAMASAPIMATPAAVPYAAARGAASFAGAMMTGAQKQFAGGVASSGAQIGMSAMLGTAGIPGLVAAVAALPPKLAEWGDALVQSQGHLAQFNGTMANIFAERRVREIRRNIESGESRAGSTSVLSDAVDDLKDDLRPISDLLANMMNFGGAGLVRVGQGIVKLLEYSTIGQILWGISKTTDFIGSYFSRKQDEETTPFSGLMKDTANAKPDFVAEPPRPTNGSRRP